MFTLTTLALTASAYVPAVLRAGAFTLDFTQNLVANFLLSGKPSGQFSGLKVSTIILHRSLTDTN